jgi:hypothetical protein
MSQISKLVVRRLRVYIISFFVMVEKFHLYTKLGQNNPEISNSTFPNTMIKHSLKAGLFTHKWYLQVD